MNSYYLPMELVRALFLNTLYFKFYFTQCIFYDLQILVWTISTFEWNGFKFFFQRMHWSELFWVISSIILGLFATWIGSYYRLYNVLHIYLNSSTQAIYINESNIISKCQHFWSTMAKCDKTSACEDAKMCAITSFRVFFNIEELIVTSFTYIYIYTFNYWQ